MARVRCSLALKICSPTFTLVAKCWLAFFPMVTGKMRFLWTCQVFACGVLFRAQFCKVNFFFLLFQLALLLSNFDLPPDGYPISANSTS